MSVLHGIRFRLRALLQRRRMDAELAEELRFHLDSFVADQVRRGVPESRARREARRLFGGTLRTRDEVRDAEGLAPWDALRQHVTYAFRGVRRAPGFAAMVALTLALGIGANGAMFGIVDQLLLRGPGGVVRPGELRRVYVTTRDQAGGQLTGAAQSYALYALLRDHTTAFAAIAGYTSSHVRIGRGLAAHTIPVVATTADFFPTLGARPYLGRFFGTGEAGPGGGAQVVVLGYGLWLRDFGGDRAVLGRTITLESHVLTIIGVAPPGFTGVERTAVDAWVPMSSGFFAPAKDWTTTWLTAWVRIVARLRPGVSVRSADAQVTAALRGGYAGRYAVMRRADVSLRPISFDENGNEPPELGVARLLFAVALVVLLVAAANAANLLLARAVRRQRELGVRVALGAGRMRLATMLLAEAGALALLGGIAGIALAYWGGALVRRTLLPSVAWYGPPVDARVMAYSALTVLAVMLLVGLVPALRATRGDTVGILRSGIPQAGDRHERTRFLLQVGEVTFSLVLLFVAALFVRSLANVRSLDLGIQPDRVVLAGVELPSAHASVGAARGSRDENLERDQALRAAAIERGRYRELLERVRHAPGVEHASVAVGLPLYSSYAVGMRLPGRDSLPLQTGGGPWIHAVTPDFFATVGTRVERGRAFTPADHEGTEPVVTVNETMARTYWPGEDPLTKCMIIQWSHACRRVVGVVADALQWKLREDAPMQYYVPYGQEEDIGGPMLLVRPRGDAASFVGPLRALVAQAAPDATYDDVKTLAELLDPQVRPWRVGAMLFGLFGALALIVAAVGLFSVLSYLVVQRTHELGVRIALGARAPQIVRLVLSGALVTTVAGAVIGAGVSLALAPLIQPLLFETGARDPVLLGVVAAALLATAVLAGLLPSWRASRVDPLIALRAE